MKSSRVLLTGLFFAAVVSGAAFASCEKDGGEWVGPAHYITTMHANIEAEPDWTFKSGARICRMKKNDDLLLIYLNDKRDTLGGLYRGIGWRKNVHHGKNNIIQHVVFPWSGYNWRNVAYEISLNKKGGQWTIGRITPIYGPDFPEEKQKRIAKSIRRNVNKVYGFW